MTAAMGVNLSTIEDPRTKMRRGWGMPLVAPSDAVEGMTTPTFAVTQALVGLLAQSGGGMLPRAPSFNDSVFRGRLTHLLHKKAGFPRILDFFCSRPTQRAAGLSVLSLLVVLLASACDN
jgi:hypothetical protein